MNTITWEGLSKMKKEGPIDWEITIIWLLSGLFVINFWIWLVFLILKIIYFFR